MRIFAFSDWRVQEPEFAIRMVQKLKPDLILYAGGQSERFVSSAGENIFEKLANRSVYGLGAVLGADAQAKNRPKIRGENVHELHTTAMQAAGYKCIGVEGGIRRDKSTLGKAKDSIHYTEEDITRHLREQAGDTPGERLLVVSHLPPFGCLDQGSPPNEASVGSKALRAFIEAHKPRLVLCGHVLSQGGKYQYLEDTLVVNISSNAQEESLARATLLILEEDKIHCETFDEWDFSHIMLNDIGYNYKQDLESLGVFTIEELIAPKNRESVLAVGGKRALNWIAEAKAILSTEQNPTLTQEQYVPLYDQREVVRIRRHLKRQKEQASHQESTQLLNPLIEQAQKMQSLLPNIQSAIYRILREHSLDHFIDQWDEVNEPMQALEALNVAITQQIQEVVHSPYGRKKANRDHKRKKRLEERQQKDNKQMSLFERAAGSDETED